MHIIKHNYVVVTMEKSKVVGLRQMKINEIGEGNTSKNEKLILVDIRDIIYCVRKQGGDNVYDYVKSSVAFTRHSCPPLLKIGGGRISPSS